MKKLKIGVVGTGFIGRQHIEAIGRIPGCQVVAVADTNMQAAQKAAEEWGIEHYYDDYQKLLSDPEVKVVHNCTPNNIHFQVNRNAIIAGKHIYSEKPLTLHVWEAEELTKLAEKYGVAAGVNLNYRHNVMVKEMRERIKASQSKIFSVEGRYLQDWLMYDTDYDWRMEPEKGGRSRAVADIGSHCFDTAQYVLGQEIVEVYAKLETVFPVRKRCEGGGETFSRSEGKVVKEIPVTNEDTAYILAKFSGGTTGIFHITQVCAGKKNGLELLVSGSDYSMEWLQERADLLWIGHRDSPNETFCADKNFLAGKAREFANLPAGHSVAWHDALKNAIAVFYQSVRNGTFASQVQDYATFRTGFQIMRIVDACMESNEKDCWVKVGGCE